MRRTMKDDEEKEQEESSDARLGFGILIAVGGARSGPRSAVTG